MRASAITLAILGVAALLGGCGGQETAPAVAVTRPVDPMLSIAIAGPVMTDQQLSHLANLDAVRPPDLPLSAPIPPIDVVPAGPVAQAPPLPAAAADCPACITAARALTLDALAERLGGPAAAACTPALRYSAIWATRLPDDLPLPASARVIEAAGSDGPACRLRAVAYGAAQPVASLLAGEHARLTRSGYGVTYAVAGGVHALTARRDRDGAVVAVIARDAQGLADVRMVIAGPR